MMGWYGGMGGWGVALMSVSTFVFLGLIIAGIVVVVRYAERGGPSGPAPVNGPTPQQVLADRFARGEIDDDEYGRRLRILGG